MKQDPQTCSFWDCGDIYSRFTRDHTLKPGEKGICKPRRRACSLEEGDDMCGMYIEREDIHE